MTDPFTLIDSTSKYDFALLNNKEINDTQITAECHQSYFVHSGQMNIKIDDKNIHISSNQGITLRSGQNYHISIDNTSKVFRIRSKKNHTDNTLTLLNEDSKGTKTEKNILNYELVSAKRIKKPWGEEHWIIWTKNHYVLKRIIMKKGFRSSLQLHKEKLETNYLISGSAKLIDGIVLDSTAPQNMAKELQAYDISKYTQLMTPETYWTSKPMTVHRVIAEEDYMAYEVSTPELDDVIRLNDDNNRKHGRIDSEHEE